jgi:hypothetical protein
MPCPGVPFECTPHLAGCRATATLTLTAKEVALRRHWTAVAKLVRCVRLARRAPPAPSGPATASDSTAVSAAGHTL